MYIGTSKEWIADPKINKRPSGCGRLDHLGNLKVLLEAQIFNFFLNLKKLAFFLLMPFAHCFSFSRGKFTSEGRLILVTIKGKNFLYIWKEGHYPNPPTREKPQIRVQYVLTSSEQEPTKMMLDYINFVTFKISKQTKNNDTYKTVINVKYFLTGL